MSELLQQRYGGPRPVRRGVLIAASTVLVTAFLGWVAWAAWLHGNPAIVANVSSYNVTGPHEVLVKIDARFADPTTQGSCLFRASALDHSVVGELNISATQIRAQQGRWISIRTERLATTVENMGCTEAPHTP